MALQGGPLMSDYLRKGSIGWTSSKNFFELFMELGVVLGENHRGTSRFLICPLISLENGHLCLKTPVFPHCTVF